MWNVENALKRLNTHALSNSSGNCAAYVRKAIEAGGIDVHPTRHAKDYGIVLLSAGFTQLIPEPFTYEAGDVVIIQPATGHASGHMAMYNGKIWISDFRQSDIYPGKTYRRERPGYSVYRYSGK